MSVAWKIFGEQDARSGRPRGGSRHKVVHFQVEKLSNLELVIVGKVLERTETEVGADVALAQLGPNSKTSFLERQYVPRELIAETLDLHCVRQLQRVPHQGVEFEVVDCMGRWLLAPTLFLHHLPVFLDGDITAVVGCMVGEQTQ